jgi:tetratricopeptide (TPR) repeat protein
MTSKLTSSASPSNMPPQLEAPPEFDESQFEGRFKGVLDPKANWLKSFVVALTLGMLFLVLMIQASWSAQDLWSEGLQAYNGQNYTQAVLRLKSHVAQSPRHAEGWFKLAMAEAKLGQFAAAQQAFEKTMELSPPGSGLEQKARSNSALMTRGLVQNKATNNAAITGVGNTTVLKKANALNNTASTKTTGADNYLAHVLNQGKVVQWDLQRMPLRVYFEPSPNVTGWSPALNNVVQQGMQQWQTATNNKIRFALVSTPSDADIKVRWKTELDEGKLGESPFKFVGNKMLQSDVVLATHPSGGQRLLGNEELQHVVVHEFGHALGLKGHSPYPEDMMYFSVQPSASSRLSARDVKTFAMLYALNPDIKNSATSLATENQSFDCLQKAQQSFAASQYQQSLSWVEKGLALTPKEPELLYLLGANYHNMGQAVPAIAAYQQAVAANPNHIGARYNLATLLINQGVSAANQGAKQQATTLFKQASTLLSGVVGKADAPKEAATALQTAQKNILILETSS